MARRVRYYIFQNNIFIEESLMNSNIHFALYTSLNTDHDDDKNIGMANKASKRRSSLSSFFLNVPNHSSIFHISTFETLLSLAGFTLYLSNYLAKCDEGKNTG